SWSISTWSRRAGATRCSRACRSPARSTSARAACSSTPSRRCRRPSTRRLASAERSARTRFDLRQIPRRDAVAHFRQLLPNGKRMETVSADVAIIGAGGAGLRAALALAEAAPKLRIALISKVYPMRSHTCAAEGGAAGVIKPGDSLEHHFNDTVGGGDWLSD